MRTGRPHDARSQGYIVAAMLDPRQCRHDSGRVEKTWRTLIGLDHFPRRELSSTNNKQRAERTGDGPNGLAACSRITARTGIAGRTGTTEPVRKRRGNRYDVTS